jgi:hypothetical protein
MSNLGDLIETGVFQGVYIFKSGGHVCFLKFLAIEIVPTNFRHIFYTV